MAFAGQATQKGCFPADPPSLPVAYAHESVKGSFVNMHIERQRGNMHITAGTHLGRRVVHPAYQHSVENLNTILLDQTPSCQEEATCMRGLKSSGPISCNRSQNRHVACSYEGTAQLQLSLRMQRRLTGMVMAFMPQLSLHSYRMRSHEGGAPVTQLRIAGEAMQGWKRLEAPPQPGDSEEGGSKSAPRQKFAS